jgi:23S rRNA (adenine2030-N6)-methyltransferase
MLENLLQLEVSNWLSVTMNIHAPSDEGFGMHGSGLFIINPPWTLPKTLTESMPILTELLELDNHGGYTLNSHIA